MRDEISPLVAVVVPIYNEIDTIYYTVEAIFRNSGELSPIQVVLVDGGSIDGTFEEAQRLSEQLPGIVLTKAEGSYAGALRTGVEAAKGEVVVFLDSSLDYDPINIADLVRPILDGKADIVSSSRFLGGSRVHRGAIPVAHRLLRAVVRIISKLLLGDAPNDPFANFVAIRRNLVSSKDIISDEVPLSFLIYLAISRRLRFQEIPVYYRIRSVSASHLRSAGVRSLSVLRGAISNIVRARRMQ